MLQSNHVLSAPFGGAGKKFAGGSLCLVKPSAVPRLCSLVVSPQHRKQYADRTSEANTTDGTQEEYDQTQSCSTFKSS